MFDWLRKAICGVIGHKYPNNSAVMCMRCKEVTRTPWIKVDLKPVPEGGFGYELDTTREEGGIGMGCDVETLISEWNPTIKELLDPGICGYRCDYKRDGKCALKGEQKIIAGDCKKIMAISYLLDRRPDLFGGVS